jgi:hypothetical protein
MCSCNTVPAELLKPLTLNLFELLRIIFERCLNGDEIPKFWKILHISIIHNEGKKSKYGNYRGITLLDNFSRLQGNIIKYGFNRNFPT